MIRLHHVPFSRSFRVLWILEELGLECDLKHYSIRDGSLRDPEYLKISPAGRVPALEIDGSTLFESGAILQTLSEMHPDAGFEPPIGHVDRPRYHEMIGYAETMASLIEQLNMHHLFLRDPSQASPVVMKIITARMAAVKSGLEGMMEEGAYLLPSGFGVADMMMGYNLLATPYYVKMAPFPKLQAYVDLISSRLAFQRAREKDGQQEFYTKEFYPVPEVA